jgi:hypothetical protein
MMIINGTPDLGEAARYDQSQIGPRLNDDDSSGNETELA